jgi:hypothetical protein
MASSLFLQISENNEIDRAIFSSLVSRTIAKEEVVNAWRGERRWSA